LTLLARDGQIAGTHPMKHQAMDQEPLGGDLGSRNRARGSGSPAGRTSGQSYFTMCP